MPVPAPRYWVYASEHVVGPYDPDEVARLPVFSADLALCPEALQGTPEESWHRAADDPAFAALFPAEQRTPEGSQPPRVGPWPPDPERETDLLATAQERMSIIDRSLEATQKRLALRREAYERLKRDIAARAASATEMEAKIRAMGARMGGFLGVKEELDQARAALAMHNQRASEQDLRLETMQAEARETAAAAEARLKAELEAKIAELEARLAEVKTAAARAARRTRPERPEKAARRERPPRPKGPGVDLGLPPASSVDIPDFS
ncbi:MAG: hypothetical protein HY928_16950 [Elusimicrobia bacterium]|nr:hypothetical protein [Elusimicrobiota bacterium]